MSADLAAIIAGEPTSFTYRTQAFTGFLSFTKTESAEMMPGGYDPNIDAKLLVTLAALGAASPQQREAVFVGATEYKIESIDRNSAFLTLNLVLAV